MDRGCLLIPTSLPPTVLFRPSSLLHCLSPILSPPLSLVHRRLPVGGLTRDGRDVYDGVYETDSKQHRRRSDSPSARVRSWRCCTCSTTPRRRRWRWNEATWRNRRKGRRRRMAERPRWKNSRRKIVHSKKTWTCWSNGSSKKMRSKTCRKLRWTPYGACEIERGNTCTCENGSRRNEGRDRTNDEPLSRRYHQHQTRRRKGGRRCRKEIGTC